MLSILNELTEQMELQLFVTNSVFWTKSKKNDNNKTENQTKNPCQIRELNPGQLASLSDA